MRVIPSIFNTRASKEVSNQEKYDFPVASFEKGQTKSVFRLNKAAQALIGDTSHVALLEAWKENNLRGVALTYCGADEQMPNKCTFTKSKSFSSSKVAALLQAEPGDEFKLVQVVSIDPVTEQEMVEEGFYWLVKFDANETELVEEEREYQEYSNIQEEL
jgi:hypothetical protein